MPVTDLLASFQINAPSPGLMPAAPLRASPVALPDSADLAPDFSAALIGLLIPGTTAKAKSERQPAAEGGKDLPASDETADPVIAWLPEGLVPVTPPEMVALPDAASLDSDGGQAPIALSPSAPSPIALPLLAPTAETVVPASALPAAAAPPGTASIEVLSTATPESAQATIVVDTALTPEPTTPVEDSPAARDRFELPVTREGAGPTIPARVALAPAPIVQAVTSGAAAQVFATAITTAAIDPATSDRPGEAAILLSGQARTEQLGTVQAMSAASQAPLDLTRDDWTGQMIDRIAALRDSAEAADTRIKLAPENLGALEVSIRRDGDRIHVHFTAENAAARQLIAEAAPRLAELADARGVKLGQTSVEAGNGGGQQAPQRDAERQPSTARNLSVASHADPIADDRIA